MLVKAGQIIAIDSVKVDPTLSGDGVNSPLGVKAVAPTVSGHAGLSAENVDNTVYIGMKPDAVMVVSTNQTVSIDKTVQSDGTVEYNLSVSAKPVVSDTKIIGNNGISAQETAQATYTIGISGDYVKSETLLDYYTKDDANATFQSKGKYVTSADASLNDKQLVLKNNKWEEVDAGTDYTPGENIDITNDVISGRDWTPELAQKADKSDLVGLATETWVGENFVPDEALDDYYTSDEVDVLLDNYALSADVEIAIAISEDWVEDNFQVKGSYASATDITSLSSTVDTKLADKAEISYVNETFQVKGDYVTSADNELSGKALVLKDNKWEEAPQGTIYTQGPNINIHGTVISGRDWSPELSAKADKTDLNNYTPNSIFEPFVDFVNDEFTATSAWALETFQLVGNYLSANALEPYYTSTQVDTIIVETKSWADNKFQLSGNYLSANALEPYYTSIEVDEAIEEFSAAITDTIIDVSATADNKFLLKENIPTIIGDKVYAGYVVEDNEYVIEGPDIVGNNGISAEFDDDNNEWNIGLSGKPVYMFDKYESDDTVTAGTVIKFVGQNYEQITADNNGYFELPATAEKVTFNINENVENNNTGLHEYLLNKFALVTDSNDVLVYTQNYYPAEVGTSNGTIAITVDHSVDPTRKYAVVYSGSDVAASANLNFTMSIYSNRI